MSQQPASNDITVSARADISGFFARHGLPPIESRDVCWDFVKTEYPEDTTKEGSIWEAPVQGFCSYTLCLDSRPHTILQFRPLIHKLELDIITAAREVYGELVPLIDLIGALTVKQGKQHESSQSSKSPTPNQDSGDGKKTLSPSLLVYSVSRIKGISLAELNRSPCSQAQELYHRAPLIESFASVIAQGLSSSHYSHLTAPRGKIGSSICHRLQMMQRELPPRFRPAVDAVLDALPRIEALPWVLTHGDIVPSNIIVNFCSHSSSTSQLKERRPIISGLIDWEEAEYLPFGVGIYGLEEFLGIQVSPSVTNISVDENGGNEPALSSTTLPSPSSAFSSGVSGGKYPPPGSKFQYFPDAESLRSLFWTELEKRARNYFQSPSLPPPTRDTTTPNPEPLPPPVLIANGDPSPTWPQFMETVKLARTLGILLWHGIAFDDGRLDRVVSEGKDDEEIQRLDMHLFGSGSLEDG